MTIITIPPEIEEPLVAAAKQRGTTPELLAVESLRTIYAPTSGSDVSLQESTLRDFLQGYVGTINGSVEPLSEQTGRRFTETLLQDLPSILK